MGRNDRQDSAGSCKAEKFGTRKRLRTRQYCGRLGERPCQDGRRESVLPGLIDSSKTWAPSSLLLAHDHPMESPGLHIFLQSAPARRIRPSQALRARDLVPARARRRLAHVLSTVLSQIRAGPLLYDKYVIRPRAVATP